MEMELKEYSRNPITGTRQLTFASRKDEWIFRHVTGEAIAVTEEFFFECLLPVFKAHGINCTIPTDFVMAMRQESNDEQRSV